jgi:hypothetical protein
MYLWLVISKTNLEILFGILKVNEEKSRIRDTDLLHFYFGIVPLHVVVIAEVHNDCSARLV